MAQGTAIDVNQYSKEELGTALVRVKAAARRYKDKMKEGAEEFMGLAIQTGAAFGIGWWIGSIKQGTFTEEDLQFFGVDKELVIGLGLVFAGLSGFLGKQMGGAAKRAGGGVLAYWAGVQGETMGSEA
jgi:hypothetical protein